MITFNNGFDELLGGGLQEGILTHIFGPPASGKTNLALLATINASGSGRVVYIDPEGGFSVERLRQMAGERLKAVLESIILVQPTTFEEQKTAIARLEEVVASTNVSLVVMDSIAMLYRMEEDKDVRMLGRMLAQLLRIGRKHNIAVLLMNQVYSDFETARVRPIGGHITEYFTKNMVELVRQEDGSRHAILRRHQTMAEGMEIEFRLTQAGVETSSQQPITGEHPLA